MPPLLQALFLIAFPAVILWGVGRSRALAVLGATVLAYVAGILWGNIPGLPVDDATALSLAEVTVPLAIPFLLFRTDFVRWLRLARRTVLSFFLAVVAAVAAAAVGALVFSSQVDEWWQVAGMFVGVYTGGTVNLTAIGLALGVRQETFVMVNAADVVVSSVYLLFLMTVAQRVLLKFLPPFQRDESAAAAAAAAEPARGPGGVAALVRVCLLAAAIVGAGAGAALLLTGRLSETVVILTVTTLGIAASFAPSIRQVEGSMAIGQYLLLIFCLAIGSMADFAQLAGSLHLLYYTGLVVSTAVVLHYALAALFRIDADTVIITSTAGIFSPPFVGPVAAALKNPEIVVSGLATGVVGYAVGNYLGLALAYLLRP